jgi:beta-galactosidase
MRFPIRHPSPLVLLFACGVACSGGKARPAAEGDAGGRGGDAGAGGGGATDAPGDGAYQPPPAGRADTLLDDGWRFLRADAAGAQLPAFDDSPAAWTSVTLPHTWNARDGEDGGSYYRGTGWYRRHVMLASDTLRPGRHAFLQIDAANIVADVYVNGTPLGQHRGGFAAFRFDATAALHVGDNVIAIRVDNSAVTDVPPLSADFTFFGGLYRDVHLLTTNDLHVDVLDAASAGVYLTPRNVTSTSADLQARVRVTNDGAADVPAAELALTVVDARGGEVARLSGTASVAAGATAEITLEGAVASPHLWDGRRDPYLYATTTQVGHDGQVTDVVAQPLGFRSFTVDANAGFSLNGRSLDLHGVNRHQDRLDMGWAITNKEHDEDMALILEMGATAVRLAHYQHAQHFYDLCDQNGLVVWAEMPLVNNVTASQAFTDNARQQLTELIRQSYNHPAIVFWSIGNEQRVDDDATNGLLTQLAALVRSEDPSRLSTYANCCTSDTSGPATHSDVTGYNQYFGWYSGTTDQLGGWADSVHAARAATGIAVSEYGAGGSIVQHMDDPPRPASTVTSPHFEEYQALLHEQSWKQLAARPFLWGKFIWNMFDFASDSRNEGDTPGRNDKGMVTYDRKTKKDAFFWYKANWSTDPFVYITGRRFNPRAAAAMDVKVYSNLDSVTLTVNGTALPAQAAADHIFVFTAVTLSAGANQVDALATRGATTATDTVTWTH